MIPKEMGLRQNYPNPFNPTTTIEISLNKDTDISLMIYNIRGEVVKQLASGSYSSGRYLVEWDGRNENGIQVASGIYIYRLQAGAFVVNRKMIISK
jgi:flagellar hook assembly protein FlgD